jgi:hypothetical protein
MVIFLISREEWGLMRMSKQNYAIELASQGHNVYFLHCPDRRRRLKRGQVLVRNTEFESLKVVDYRLFFPLFIKYRFFYLYRILFKIQFLLIKKVMNVKPDLIWSFDTEADVPINIFGKRTPKIYMPVDGPFNHDFELFNANYSTLIVSVTERIINRYKIFDCKKEVVNHGVGNEFFKISPSKINDTVKKAGYSGSLVRNDLHFNFFKRIIEGNPMIMFEFWGEYDVFNSTIHSIDDISFETIDFIKFLMNADNVILHGPVNQSQLSIGLNSMDLLIIAYNISDDQNHHKVNEYLTTGKIIISTYMSSFSGTDLLILAENNCDEDTFLNLFDSVVSNYSTYMTADKIKRRIEYAQKNSYESLTRKILEKVL